MITNITVHGSRGIEADFELKDMNVFEGENASGKSTMIQIIKDIYKGKTSIKEGDITIKDSNNTVFAAKNGKLFGNIGLGTQMDLMFPGFFMNGTPIAGVNKSTEDKRKTISDLLGIDRDGFFAEHKIDYTIKGLTSQLRDVKTKETTYAEEICEEENAIAALEPVIKPKEVKEKKGNREEINTLNAELDSLIAQLRPVQDVAKPEEVVLTTGNQHELDALNKELAAITQEGKSVTDTCPTCSQKIPDAETVRENIRAKYVAKAEEINAFELIPSNQEEYQAYIQQKSNYDATQENIAFNTEHQKKIDAKAKELSDIKVIEGNEEEYKAFLEAVKSYDNYNATVSMHRERIERITERIQGLDSNGLQEKIDAYKEVEKKFVEFVENKLTIGDMKIVFYRELKTPNTDGDMFTPTFNIEYKGKMYDQCSGGERGMIDVILARIFIQSFGLLDFILIDNAEISKKNLKKIIQDELKGLQVITTKIGTGKLKLSHTL